MRSNKTGLVTALMITTLLTSGTVWAATSSTQPSGTQPSGIQPSITQPSMTRMQTAEKDFIQLSADATRAYQDLTISRFDIFDGRVDDAKKHIDDAVKGFDKAKTDETVFTKAEADMMPSKQTTNQPGTSQPSSDQAQKPIAWLPVDATVMINEDYTLNPAKSAAVADANKSLKSGDRKAAMEKLKLASLDTDVVMAVVPLDKTINDVHQAAQLIDSGKYYEGSQLLRQVQNAERFDSMDISGMPTKAANNSSPNSSNATATTTPPKH